MKEPKSEAANQDGFPALASAHGSAAACEPATWLCPFCRNECAVGWDCSCGAKAIASALWIDPAKPLMRHQKTCDEVMILSIMGKHLGLGVSEMLQAGVKPPNIVSIYPKGRLAKRLVGKLDLSSCLSRTRYARQEVRIENNKCVGWFVGKVHP